VDNFVDTGLTADDILMLTLATVTVTPSHEENAVGFGGVARGYTHSFHM